MGISQRIFRLEIGVYSFPFYVIVVSVNMRNV